MPTLNLQYEGKPLNSFELDAERLTIGRRMENDIQIDDPAVSGQHATVSISRDPIFTDQIHVDIEDCNSTNGTLVNGERIGKKRLYHGDVIAVGRHELIYHDQQVSALEQTAIYIPDADA